MTFSRASDKLIIIDHTEVPDALRGQRIGDRLVARAVADAREKGFKIFPLCPFAAAQFRSTPEYRDVLSTMNERDRAATGDAGADRHVVGTAQPLDRADAILRQPRRLRGRRRAVLRGLSAALRRSITRCASEILRAPRDGLAQGRGRACRVRRPSGKPAFYQKHMTHHMLPEIGRDWMRACRHAFLIRHPARVLASYAAKREAVDT